MNVGRKLRSTLICLYVQKDEAQQVAVAGL